MTKLTPGTKVRVLKDFIIENIGVEGVVDFQCSPNAGLEGLVYVNWMPKGKRKVISKAFSRTQLEII